MHCDLIVNSFSNIKMHLHLQWQYYLMKTSNKLFIKRNALHIALQWQIPPHEDGPYFQLRGEIWFVGPDQKPILLHAQKSGTLIICLAGNLFWHYTRST